MPFLQPFADFENRVLGQRHMYSKAAGLLKEQRRQNRDLAQLQSTVATYSDLYDSYNELIDLSERIQDAAYNSQSSSMSSKGEVEGMLQDAAAMQESFVNGKERLQAAINSRQAKQKEADRRKRVEKMRSQLAAGNYSRDQLSRQIAQGEERRALVQENRRMSERIQQRQRRRRNSTAACTTWDTVVDTVLPYFVNPYTSRCEY